MQQAAVIMTAQRERGEQARARALVRFNGLMFHGLAAASFLETAAPLHVGRLGRVFADHPDVGLWLEQVWWPQRAGHGRLLRSYVEATWPEFDWSAAYDEFHEAYRTRYGTASAGGSLALEALARCVAETQAAVFYRALASYADEPALRGLAREAGRDHAFFFDHFRSVFERCKRHESVGFAAACRTVLGASRAARDLDVAAAFQPLARHWNGNRLVPELGYGEFLERMGQLVERHAALGRVERLLFRPWARGAAHATVAACAVNPVHSAGRIQQPVGPG